MTTATCNRCSWTRKAGSLEVAEFYAVDHLLKSHGIQAEAVQHGNGVQFMIPDIDLNQLIYPSTKG